MTHKHLKGIGGWLLLLVLAIGVVSPLVAAIRLVVAFTDSPLLAMLGARRFQLLMVLQSMICALSVLACWYPVARLIFVRRWSSVRVAIACLWLATPLLLAVQVGLTTLMRWGTFRGMLTYALSGTSLPLWAVTAIVWTAYLLRSKRVARTYARPGFAAASAEETARVFA
jgi:hypothetical protein